MKKILFCASRVSHILNFHIPYIKYFKENGYTVDIAVQGNTNINLIDNCFDLKFTKSLFSADNIKTIFKLKNIIKTGNYDIICSNTTLAGVAVRTAMMLIGNPKPYLVHISHGYMFGQKNNFKSKIYLLCEKMTSKPVDSLAVMNKEDYILAEKYHLGENIYYIYGMGVCAEKFPVLSLNERNKIRQKIGASENTKLILCVGEFSARKNQTAVITAFNKIAQKHKNAVLIFAGEGQTLKKCKDMVYEYELEDRVRFLGQVDDINSIYRSCDILLSASKMEGLPFNVMEALLCGLPVIVSDIKGHNDLIIDRKNGLLFKKDNVDDMVQKIDELFSDESLFTYICSNARLEQKYMLQNAEPQLLKILDKNYRYTVFDSKKS